MGKNNKFTDQELYEMSVHNAYDIGDKYYADYAKGKEIFQEYTSSGKKIVKNYTVVDIQHDAQTGFDAMAVKDDKGNIII